MKTRMGFVSNSSSSSFIVAGDKNNSKLTMMIEVDLEDFSEKVITTISELNEYIVSEYGWADDDGDTAAKIIENGDFSGETYAKMIHQLDMGKVIYVGSVYTSSGEAIEEYVANNGFGKTDNNFIIIQDAGDF
jgi:hypothetical protein